MKRFTKYFVAAMVLTLMFSVNCQAAVKKVTITAPTKNSTYTVYRTNKNVTRQIKATVKTTNKKDSKALTYKSSNKKVVSVNSKGKLTIKATGKATITVASQKSPKIKDTLKITVKQGATKLVAKTNEGYVIGKSFTMTKGKSITANILATPSGASKSVKWSSSNKRVATVSSKGVIKAVKNGTAKITATAKDGCGAKFTTTIKVVSGKVTSVKVNKTSVQLVKGKSTTIKATVKTSGSGANKNVVWSSSNTKVAKVNSNGKITAVKKGTATITVKAVDGSGKKATVKVVVINKTPEPTEPSSEEPTKPSVEPTQPSSEEPTKPSVEPTEPSSEEPTKPSVEPTEPSSEPTKPSVEPTEPSSEEPTKPSVEPTEPSSEEPTKPSEEETVKYTVTVDTQRAAESGITAKGTNTIKWNDAEKAMNAASELTADTSKVLAGAGIATRFTEQLGGTSVVVDGKTYVTKFVDNKWILVNTEGKEVDVKTTLSNKTITNFTVGKATTKAQLDVNLKRLYLGHNLLKDKTYDFGTGVITVGDTEYNVTRFVADGKKHVIETIVNNSKVTVDMEADSSFTVTAVKSLKIDEIFKGLFGDSINVKAE